ncbi:short transient receptor potential channel 4-associated protein-like [Argopecten irradians]|uniref:short transient receptor potential channel 4-associated protein-like n=1 Tax=Argopecten irradians TaxID=31199 RepID=UPI003717C9AB
MLGRKLAKSVNKNSVFLAHELWQYSGNAYRRISQLPEHIVEDLSDGSGIPELIAELDHFSVRLDAEDDLCWENLKTLLGNLMNFEPRRSQDEASLDEEQNKYATQFYEHGGVEVLLRILMFNTVFPKVGRKVKVGFPESELLLRVKSLVLEILTKVTTTCIGDKVTAQLMASDDVLNYVFTLLAHQKTFINSCQLVEDMLQSRREVLDLHRIHNLRGLISTLEDHQLANFCRILAVAISDLDIYENKSSLFQQNKQKRSRGFVNIRDINQGKYCATFWLARAVESYLRGNTSYCDQVFLMRRGLLQHVASNIVEHEIRHKEILQSSFDLLGELIKFNIEAFKTFEEILTTQAKFEKFITTVNRNLVDSNMFIRSLVLSLEHLTEEDTTYKEYAKKDNKLLMYIGDFSKQLDYLYKLIKIINVENLTQENVSCLNTTLVFLMFANRKGQLPKYLQALRDEKEDLMDVSGSANLLRNFRDLLTFWQDHYLHKDKDCSALEKSSRISFEYWKQTVSVLVCDDKDDKAGILHYVSPMPCDRPN